MGDDFEVEMALQVEGLRHRAQMWLDGVISDDEFSDTLEQTKVMFDEYTWLKEK